MNVKSAEEITNLIKELDIEELKGAEIEGDLELEIESSIFIQQIAPQLSDVAVTELSGAIQNLSNMMNLIKQ